MTNATQTRKPPQKQPAVTNRNTEPSASSWHPDAYLFLTLMVLIGSSTATAAKIAVAQLPPSLIPVIRFGGAGLCLLPFVWKNGFGRMLRESPGRVLASAALCVPINQTFFLNATRLAPTTHVGLIYAGCPLVVLILAVALGQERLEWRRVTGILVCVAGMLVVGIGNLWHWGVEGAEALRGDLLLVGAVTSWGGYLTVSKPLIARHGALNALVGTFLLGSVLILPITLVATPDWSTLAHASRSAWLSVAYLTLIVTVFGLACQNLSLRYLDASQVATVGNASPILTVLWGVWLLHEPFRWSIGIGAVLTFAGIFVITRPEPGRA